MIWESNDQVNEIASKYSIVILNIACDPKVGQNKKLPTSAWLVHYLDMKKDSDHYEDFYDIVMGSRVDIFDCYYDKIGSKRLKSIGYTSGNIHPGQFNTKAYLAASR